MENVAKPIDKDSPIQKTEVTTSIKDGADNIHSDHEPNEAAHITVDKDNPNNQKLQGEIIPDETKLIAGADQDASHNFDHTEERGDNLTKSVSTVEEGEIAFDQQLILNESLENHPYKDLLLSFEPTSEQLSIVHKLEPPKSLEQTPLIDIDKRDHLESLVNDLKNEKEIGVDVEWSDHGYEALVCLVQLSTRDKDYIIDTIALKDHMHLLKDIFVNPNIVKIFHDASNDLKWLQQDFELFVVNMFDTQRAMRALGYSQLGLDFALQRYKVVTDKSMQRRVDFRKRPLPPKYKDYVKTNSHFLINMYQVLKNKLIEVGSLVEVLNQCNNDCMVVHKKVADNPYMNARREILEIHKRQLVALEKLNQWRHRIAKYADIYTGGVLSRRSMKKLALELPVDGAAIKQICNSSYARQRLQEIIDILLEVNGLKAIGSKGPLQKFSPRGGFTNKRKADQIDFDGAAPGQGPFNRNKKFYGGDTGRGRGKANNKQNDLFDLRNTLRNIPFRGNKNRRGFGRQLGSYSKNNLF